MTGTEFQYPPPSADATGGRGALRRGTLRLGTRRSQLATAQSGWVARQVSRRCGRPVEMVGIVTAGDLSSAPITALGSTGVFVTALREALLRGEVDFVVHSFKDLPTAVAPGLRLAAVPARQDPRDALVDGRGRLLRELPPGTRVGTGSARRAVELGRLGLPVTVVPMRGNVDTRLRRVTDGEVDAVILAAAGLARLDRLDVVTELIDPDLVLPAPAQGALAVECRDDDEALAETLAAIDDPASRTTALAERAYLTELNAGCTAPVGAYARLVDAGALRLDVLAARDDGTALRMSATGPVRDGRRLGRELAAAVLAARSPAPSRPAEGPQEQR